MEATTEHDRPIDLVPLRQNAQLESILESWDMVGLTPGLLNPGAVPKMYSRHANIRVKDNGVGQDFAVFTGWNSAVKMPLKLP